MLRFLFRLVVLAVVIVVGTAIYYGYGWWRSDPPTPPVGTSGGASDAVADISHRVSDGAILAGKAVSEAALTSKIRSKMVLDDTIDASRVNVDTVGTVVTVTGSVATKAQKQRVLQLARETSGVTSVVDRVEVKTP